MRPTSSWFIHNPPPRKKGVLVHPAKFPEAVAAATGHAPKLPDWLGDLGRRDERITVLPADQAAVEKFVLSASRAAREGAAA